MAKLKEQFTSRKFKGGAYSTIISVVVIAVIIIINLIFTEINVTKDFSENSIFSILDSTKEYLEGIKDKITIYYLVQDGGEIDLFKNIINDFNTANKNVQITAKDPIKNPKFVEQYVDGKISEHSFLVVDETNGKSRYLDYNDIVINQFDYDTYQYQTVGFDLEGQLVSGINYVTSEKLPTMYCLTGHGETGLSSRMSDGISKENYTTKDLPLLTEGEIPEDCDVLFINNPQHDLDSSELEVIEEYVSRGGNILALIDYNASGLSNLMELVNGYGILVNPGFVVEGEAGYYMMRTPYQIVPNVLQHEITSGLTDKFAVCAISAGMTISPDKDDSVEVQGILQTSDSAYSKTDVNTTTLSFEEGDIEGPFYVGLSADRKNEDGSSSKLVVYSSGYFMNDNLLASGSFANEDMFYNSMNYMAAVDNSVSVRAVSLAEEMVTVDAATGNMYGLIYIFLIPVAVLVAGIVVVVRRRRL